MSNFPLKSINREQWQKKISCTSMYTIPAQDQAYPVLQQLNQILTLLLEKPIYQTLDQTLIQYFFTGVFPTVCQKIIRSRYFKNIEVLKISNLVLQKSVYLPTKYIEYTIKYPKFLQLLTTVLSDQFYFKHNNQMSYMIYPYSFYPNNWYQIPLEIGNFVDVLKIGNMYEKLTWSQGKVVQLDDYEVEIAYLYDGNDKKIKLKRDSPQIALYKTKSKIFQWRMGLKRGDLVDVEDSFGTWYNATVLDIIDLEQGKKNVKVTLKVYHQHGPKQDQNGFFYGFTQYQQILDITSPKLAPFSTIARQYCYQSNKSITNDTVQDLNDCQFQQINGQKIYALPRRKYLSQFQFQTINQFGKRGGFQKYLQYLEKQVNFDVLCYFVKGISGVTSYLHRGLVKDLIQKIKNLFQRYLFGNIDKTTKTFTKQQSEMAFSGLKVLQKRIYSNQYTSKYENTLKMKLADICLQSQAIKNKLLGLNQLKDIVRSVTYTSHQKNKYIRIWVKNNKIFQKIYIINSHVQLIKKSQQFFKYLINQSILQVTDLQRLYKMAQKGDFQSRVSLYKLFQQVSHIFKKQHVQFLIDTILQSQLNLILNQDIDLLHELSRFSNYFPLQKVIKFFENIILGDNKVKQLNDYAIKRYSEIVAKNTDVKPYRRSIIKNFLDKLYTHDVLQVTKVLKGIFEGICVGDWQKKDLNQILIQQKVDQVVVQTLNKYKQQNQFQKTVTILLDFLLSIYKLSHKIKINIKILDSIWSLLCCKPQKQKQFYRWANQISKLDQSFQNANIQQLQNLYRKLFNSQLISQLQSSHFELAKNLFVEINKKLKYITITNTFKDRQMQKQYHRKVSINNLKLIDILLQMIYNIKSDNINNQALSFFIQLYTSKDNPQSQTHQFLTKLITNFQKQYKQKNYHHLIQTIKLLQIIINDSQKYNQNKINSLLTKKQESSVKFIIINQINYLSSESVKKSNIILAMNTTIIKLRKLLAKQYNISSWQQIKITSHKQIIDYDNSRTLKQLKLNPNQPLTISRRSINTISQQQLILNDSINPKAIRCFKIIFDKYSTDGKMDKNQCNSFTMVCLGSNCTTKYYNEKISSLYEKYDDDNDGFLTFQNFILFYEDAIKDRPSTVWSNLKSFNVRGDFRFFNQPQQSLEISQYPRNIIAEYPNVYDILFDLLHNKQVASVAFQLLQRLPISKTIQIKLLNIQNISDLQQILSTTDLYELYYKLNIIEYLAHSKQLQTEMQKNWHSKFIQLNGYQILYQCVYDIVNRINMQKESQQIGDIVRQIFYTSLNLFNQYWIQCFSGDANNVRLSLAFVDADQEMDDKLDYLIFGKFFKSQRKLQAKLSKLPNKNFQYSWKSKSKSQIYSFLINQLENKWKQISHTTKNPQQNQKRYSLTMVINKIIGCLNILLINEDPQPIANIIPTLLDKIPSSDLIKNFYYFVLSQCFFSKQTKYQGIYIRELFKNLTKGTITSQHFRVLALLVSRFGIESMSDQGQSEQTTQKMKQVLFENVLNNKNELTVEGCAKLLSKFNLSQTSYQIFRKIWQQRLFNPSTLNQKQQVKVALYQLILKICDSNLLIINKIIYNVLQTLNKQLKSMKIVYCNEFKQRSSTGYVGLKNLGSTCYINSMVQQLFMNKNFRYCILRADDGEPSNLIEAIDNKNQVRTVDDNFLHQLQRIFANLELTSRIDFAPRDFCVAYKPFGQSVNVLIQQDVQQFVSMFFDRLQAGLSKTIFKKLVSDFYIGKTINLFKCHTCEKTKKVQQTFHSISLEVKTSKTLAESFTRFCHGEMISDYTCEFCNNKVDVTKKTRISLAPKMLIIHLQRIVFNLDTFINQKITTKHSFPNNFNLFQTTLDYYEQTESGAELPQQEPKQYDYHLIGIICHSGTADSGHYISYIKTAQNKWIQFNDSLVTPFNPSNIQSECFGGYFASTTYEDDFYQQKKQSSKSAYLLIYEKQGQNTIQLILNKKLQNCKDQREMKKLKQQFLQTLNLKQVVSKIKEQVNVDQIQNQKVLQNQNNQNTAQIIGSSHEQSSSAPEDSQNQTKLLLQQKQLQIKRHQSQDNIQVTNIPINTIKEQMVNSKDDQNKTQLNKEIITYIKDPVSSYLPQSLREQIYRDNEVHFFEKCLSSPSFVKFFSMLISKPNDLYKQILPICQKLTFGFWLKSPSFKDLLQMLDGILKIYPAGFDSIVTNNSAIISLLIESSDSQIRTSMANFLSKIIGDTIQAKKISIATHNDDPIFKFLDNLFALLPSTVSRCWTKFGQYFQFWYELSNRGQRLVQYMIDRQIVKYFMDYFLDTKSPLKIYATKRQHQIGSSYANPNFSMLLKCVFSLLQQRMILNQKNKQAKQTTISFTQDEQKLLMSCESLQKLIADNYQNIAAQLTKQICPHNLQASQKVAFVILKGISKSNSETIQPYLQVLHQFVIIDDQYQDLRIKWVIGKQTLAVSNLSYKIIALNSYSLNQKIYNFDSTINLQGGSSLLQPIITYYNRIQTFALLCTRQIFKLCDINKKIRKLIFSLQSPMLIYASFIEFLKVFIEKYNEDNKRSYGYYTSSSGFNRQQFGKEVKQLFEKVVKKAQLDSIQQQQQQKKQQNQVKTANKSSTQQIPHNQHYNTQKQTKQQIKSLSDQAKQQTAIQQKYQINSYLQNIHQLGQVPQLTPTNSDIPHSLKKNVSNDSQLLEINTRSQGSSKQNTRNNIHYDGYDEDGWQNLDMQTVQQIYPKRSSSKKDSQDQQKNKNNEKDINTYNIKVIQESKVKDQNSLNITDQQDQQLMKAKQQQNLKQIKKPINNDYNQCWHPVKFQYTPITSLQHIPTLPNIKIQQHESNITYVLTRPTGTTNRSFTSMVSSSKICERINQEVWGNQKLVKGHGFFVKNNSRDNIRILTDDGCLYCKSGDNLFVWTDKILKVWDSQRTFQWPKWSMFADKNNSHQKKNG